MQVIAYWKPGRHLDDIALKKLHSNLLKVNFKSGAKIKHKMLESNSTLDEIRELLKDSIISEFVTGNDCYGFLISPILANTDLPILHTGLMVIEKNPGVNLMALLFTVNVRMSYENLGAHYITNISSTPSAIENFSEIIKGTWPSPLVGLKKSPSGFKDVVQKLKSDYLDIYFPETDKIKVDYKRFTMTSNSSEMGFSTNFYKISRADSFKYNLFCQLWINYEEEEDIIQVGKVSFFNYFRSRVALYFLLQSCKKLKIKEDSKPIEDEKSEEKLTLINKAS